LVDPNGHSPSQLLNAIYNVYMMGWVNQLAVSIALITANGANPFTIGTALHEIAQVHAAKAISKQFGPAILEYKIGSRKEADIVAAGKVWEVKKLGGESPEPQLEQYTKLGGLKRGNNTGLEPISDITIIGDIKMEVTFGANPGEVYYECYKYGKDGERVNVPNWQVWWEFKWRKDTSELAAAAAVIVAVFVPETLVPLVPEIVMATQ
jgi:hypothetical protein